MVFQKKTPWGGDEPRKGNSEKFCIFYRSHQSLSRSCPSTFMDKVENFCALFSVLALDSASPNYFRIVLHLPWNCSHCPISTLPSPGFRQALSAILEAPVAYSIWDSTIVRNFPVSKVYCEHQFVCIQTYSPNRVFSGTVAAVAAGNLRPPPRTTQMFPYLDNCLIKLSSNELILHSFRVSTPWKSLQLIWTQCQHQDFYLRADFKPWWIHFETHLTVMVRNA